MIRFFSATLSLLVLLHENQVSCIREEREREGDIPAKVFCFLILPFIRSLSTHVRRHTPSLRLFHMCLPYVLEHLDQTFFFFFFFIVFFLLRLCQKIRRSTACCFFLVCIALVAVQG
jgi:hypothetical protein